MYLVFQYDFWSFYQLKYEQQSLLNLPFCLDCLVTMFTVGHSPQSSSCVFLSLGISHPHPPAAESNSCVGAGVLSSAFSMAAISAKFVRQGRCCQFSRWSTVLQRRGLCVFNRNFSASHLSIWAFCGCAWMPRAWPCSAPPPRQTKLSQSVSNWAKCRPENLKKWAQIKSTLVV